MAEPADFLWIGHAGALCRIDRTSLGWGRFFISIFRAEPCEGSAPEARDARPDLFYQRVATLVPLLPLGGRPPSVVRGWAIQFRGQASGHVHPGWTGALAVDAAGPGPSRCRWRLRPLCLAANGAVLVRRSVATVGDIIFLFLFLGVRGGDGWSRCRGVWTACSSSEPVMRGAWAVAR